MARHLGLPLTGVLGVLLRAKKMKRITAVKPELHALRRKAGFFIAPNLETIISEKARKRCKKIESFDTKAHRI
jgi:predicted nucleic acid-binding protein